MDKIKNLLNAQSLAFLLLGACSIFVLLSKVDLLSILAAVGLGVSFWWFDKQYNFTQIDNIIEENVRKIIENIKNKNA